MTWKGSLKHQVIDEFEAAARLRGAHEFKTDDLEIEPSATPDMMAAARVAATEDGAPKRRRRRIIPRRSA